MKKIYLLLSCIPLFLNAQNYVQLTTDLTPLVFASADFADFDKDGDQDLAVIGVDEDFNDLLKIYRNDEGVFNDMMVSFPPMHMGAISWVDYDSDGDFDLFCSGQDYASNAFATIYKNTDGNFSDALVDLPLGFWNSAGWGDFDNDGDLDLAFSWYTESLAHSAIFRNDDGVYVDMGVFMDGLTAGSMEWGDFDSDGDLDLLHTGTSTDFSKTPVKLYVNNEGNFTEGNFDFLDCAWYNNVLWSDMDNDGDLDIVYVADKNDQYPFVYYKNTLGVFEENYTGLFGVRTSNGNIGIVQGDIDNDGDVDYVMTGDNPGYTKSTRIFVNNDGEFTELDHNIPGFGSGTIDLTDIDNDGDLDLYMTGYNQANNVIVGMYINLSNSNAYSLNEAPDTPSELLSVVDVNHVSFSWLPATDDHTPEESLNYNLYVGSSSGTADVVCAQSIIDEGSEDFGFHFIPKPGNCQMSLQHMIANLPDGQYYWSVQAIDQSGMTSIFAEEQSFQVGEISLTHHLQHTVHIYPNPATKNIWIELGDIFSAEIYNMRGQLVIEKQDLKVKTALDIRSLKPGNYILKLRSQHQTFTEELIIIK